MKDSEILKNCRHFMLKNNSNHSNTHWRICTILRGMCFANPKISGQVSSIIAWIESMLGEEHNTYDDWLDTFVENNPNEFKWNIFFGADYAYYGRIAWLDWMIKECEQEEDRYKHLQINA